LIHPNVEGFAQFQHSLLEGLPENGLGPGAVYYANHPDTFQQAAILRQAWLKLKTNLDDDRIALTIGRTRFMGGAETTPEDPVLNWVKSKRVAQRLLGPFDYTHIGRSFDGVTLAYDRGDVNVTGFWHRPTTGGFEIHGGRHIDEIDVFGASVTSNIPIAGNPTDARLFYIYYGDNRPVVRLDNRPLVVRQADLEDTAINTIGANFAHVIPVGDGTVDLLAWVTGQTGDWQSQSHSAWAYSFEAGYQLPEVVTKPWLRVGLFRSSGDDNPSDNHHGSFFQLLPTARLYALTPFFNLMNNQDLFAQLLLKPAKKVGIRTDLHWLRVTEPRDFAYFGGGATKRDFFGYGGVPANGKRDLGILLDMGVTWKLVDMLEIGAYYGHVFGQAVYRAAFPVKSHIDYGFIEGTVSF